MEEVWSARGRWFESIHPKNDGQRVRHGVVGVVGTKSSNDCDYMYASWFGGLNLICARTVQHKPV